MSPALFFQQLFRHVLARHVEYSYGEKEDGFTSMIPLSAELLPRAIELAASLSFAGDWAWAIDRFADAVKPDEFLFRLDWQHDEPVAITLYCRFPSEPDTAGFQRAVRSARPFTWNGPDPSLVASTLGVAGPRGMAFRASNKGNLRTAVYFRSDQHAGASWTDRLTGLLAACRFPEELAPTIERDLKELYRPGPVGVIGVDDGPSATPGALKFDPANVPIGVILAFLARMGVPASRLDAMRKMAIGLRAESVTYAGVQYGREGFSGFRVYFACEPGYVPAPGRVAIRPQRNLRPVRRLPHY
jgi:hypothetical protein